MPAKTVNFIVSPSTARCSIARLNSQSEKLLNVMGSSLLIWRQ